jgi:hypothetical protein
MDLLVVAIPVSKPKRNVPIAANRAIPKVYNNPMMEYGLRRQRLQIRDEMYLRRENSELEQRKGRFAGCQLVTLRI